MTREEFIQEVTDGLAPPPAYFPENVRLNKEGYDAFDAVMERGLQALKPAAFAASMKDTPGVLVIDTRLPEAFAEGHVPGSIFIGLDGNFAPWVGSMFPDLSRPILLITDEGKEEEAVRRLSRVGFDNGIGILAGGLSAWSAEGLPTEKVVEIDAPTFAAAWKTKPLATLDVRKPSENEDGHVDGAQNTPLEDMATNLPDLDANRTYHLHCKAGYRSLMAWSMLHQAGYRNLVNIQGGFDALQETTLPIVQPV
jgi:rhodanese-related sulfurtransferase